MSEKLSPQEGPPPPPPPPQTGVLPYPQYYAQSMPIGFNTQGMSPYHQMAHDQTSYPYYQGALAFNQGYHPGQPPPPAQPYGISASSGMMHFSPHYAYAHGMNMYPSAAPSMMPHQPQAQRIVVYPTPPSVDATSAQTSSNENSGWKNKGRKYGHVNKANAISAEPYKKQKTGYEMVDPNELSVDHVRGLESKDRNMDSVSTHTSKKDVSQLQTFHSYCEACEKDFASSSAWQTHLAAHEKCPYEGCDFAATKKALSTHWQLVHGEFSGNGLKEIEVEVDGRKKKFKVLMGTSPEEVEQWREERRKKFPSAGNVEAKRNALEKVKSLGGIEPFSKSSAWNKSASSQNEERKRVSASSESATESRESDVLTMKNATSASASNASAFSSSSSSSSSSSAASPDGDLNADMDDDPTTTKESSGDLQPKSEPTEKKIALCQHFTRGKCKHGETCRYTHDKTAQLAFIEENRKRKRMSAAEIEQLDRKEYAKRGKLYLPKPLAGGDRGTLLKRLLQDDIMAEENIILQCFRYMTSHNFFEE